MSRSSNDAELRMTRKDFFRAGAMGALGLGLSIGDASAREGSPSPAVAARVALARDRSVMSPEGLGDEKAVARVLEQALRAYSGKDSALDALSGFVKPTDRVGIKMNVMMTGTHPALVEELARLLTVLGVKDENIVVWDRDSAGRGVRGARSRDERFGFGENHVSRIINEHVDVLINIAGLKTHWLSGIAGALKNWAGAVTRINVRDVDTPFPIHLDSCVDIGMLAALEPIRARHRLSILDALHPLYEGGPQVNPAYLWHYGGVLVSEDQVALDTIGLELLSLKRNEVRGRDWPISPPPKHILAADSKYGLGVADRNKIELTAVGETEGRLI